MTLAYYSVPINKSQTTFLRFRMGQRLLENQLLPNGLCPGPQIFTKLLKPIYAELAEKGHIGFPYLDDSFVISKSHEECRTAIFELAGFSKVGFKVNEEK